MHVCRKLRIIALLLCCAAPAACGTGGRTDKAQAIAATGALARREIAADPFVLTVFERVQRPGGPATVYIEGDGLAFLGYSPSLDPTPSDPVALALASADPGANVIYLARPCQYSKMIAPEPCPMAYWTGKRFAPEVITAMNEVLDGLRQRHGIPGFDLVGYSGGAAIAVLLAARRRDVASLRTVAGNLDNAALIRLHKVDPMPESLNAADAAASIATLPQHHFIGAKDEIAPLAIYQSYRQRAGGSTCIRHSQIAGAGHQGGWAALWPDLLRAPVDCSAKP